MNVSQAFTAPENKAHTYKEKGINVDIRDYLERLFPKAVANCTNVEKIFKGKNEQQTAHLIWLFLRKHCKYRRDLDSHQLIRLPAYFINHKPHQGDCKTFALFARAVYAAIYPECETAFKFTAYSQGAKTPSHVYTVVKDKAGRQIIIDGCWVRFNHEKNYTLALPLNFKAMKITSLAGIDMTNPNQALNAINEHCSPEVRERIKKAVQLRQRFNLLNAERDGGHVSPEVYNQRLQVIRDEVNAIGKLSKEEKAKRKAKAKKGGKKFLWGIAFINLAPIRGAFSAVVAMNANGLATNLKYLYDHRNDKTKEQWKKIENIWQKVGGLKKALIKGITIGAKHKPLFLSKKRKKKFEERHKGLKGIFAGEGEGINIAPAVIAAALAAASGIFAAMIPVIMQALKKNGKNEQAQEVAEQGQELVDKQQAGQLQKEVQQGADEVTDAQAGESDETMNDYIGDANTWANLTEALTQVAKVGITAAGTAIAKKVAKKPKAKATLEKLGEGADDYFTGRYLRQSGYKKAAQDFSAGVSNNKVLLIGGGLAAALVAIFALKK